MQTTYDPNSETTNSEKVLAGRWECLRRNKEFRALSAQWTSSEEFRHAHALSADYHDMHRNAQRCAWDWMLTAAQRVCLAKLQIEKLRWAFDSDFNFGPITCHQNFSPVDLTSGNWREFFRVEPLANPPKPITVDQSWGSTPDEFKKQFRLAYTSKSEFGQINDRLAGFVIQLRVAASKIAAGDPHNEGKVIAQSLFSIGTELRELAEFSRVFKIPNSRHSVDKFHNLLGQIQNAFMVDNLLVPTKTYTRHESYQGTQQDWRWFLTAENLGLDMRKAADCYKLAEIYCEDIRQRAMRGKAPRRAKTHGHSGSKFSSKVIKNRRSTVKRHVQAIEKWILAAYPLPTVGPSLTAS